MKHGKIRFLFMLLALFGLTTVTNVLFAQTYKIGDVYTFPDGSQGIVCYVNPDNPTKGWAVALDDLPQKYAIYQNENLPNELAAHNDEEIVFYSISDWEFEGKKNTKILHDSGKSPLLNDPDVESEYFNGWYVPDAVQLRQFFSLIPVIKESIFAAGGSVNTAPGSNDNLNYWSSSKNVGKLMWEVGYTNTFIRHTHGGSTQLSVRLVRDFSSTDAYAYWVQPFEQTGVKSASYTVSPTVTTDYDALVVYGIDTFPLQSTVYVYETYDKDIYYDTVCSSPLPYTSLMSNSIFKNLDISNPGDQVIRKTLQTVNGCDSIITLQLHVIPSYFFEKRDTICQSDTPYVWTNHNVAIPTAAGDHIIWDSLTTREGCDSVYKLLLKIVPTPDLQITPVGPVCTGRELNLSASATNCTSFEDLMREGFNRVKGNSGTDISGNLSRLTDWIAQGSKIMNSGDTAIQIGSGSANASAEGWIRTKEVNLSHAFTLDLHLRKYRSADYPVPVEIKIDGVSVDTIIVDNVNFEHYVLNYEPATAHSILEVHTLYLDAYPRIVMNEIAVYDNSPCIYVWNINGDLTYSADTLIADPRVGVYRVRAISARGCVSEDSLRVVPLDPYNDIRAICTSELPYVTEYDTTFQEGTVSGTYVLHRRTPDGCDYTVNLHLTVNESYYFEEADVTICDNETFIWNDHSRVQIPTKAGVYVLWDSLTTVNGCDSIYRKKLTIKPTYDQDEYVRICEDDLPYTWRGETFPIGTETSNYMYQKETVDHCDSVVRLHLTVGKKSTGSDNQTACDSYAWNGVIYTSSGEYIQTLTNAAGCDSIVTLQLTINNSTHNSNVWDACDSYEWNGNTYTSSGVYSYDYTNAVGCPSTDTLHLTIKHSTTFDTSAVACESYTWRGTEYTTSGNHEWHGTNAAGCDSTATLHLTIHNPVHQHTTEAVCEFYTWEHVDGTTSSYTESGDYTYSHRDAHGCTQVDTLHLTIYPSYDLEVYDTVCQNNLPYVWRNITFDEGTVSGNYEFRRVSVHGCDSIVTLHLTVSPLPEVRIALLEAVCPNAGLVDITAEVFTATKADYTYTWSGDLIPVSTVKAANQLSDTATLNILTSSCNSIYKDTVTVTDGNGCSVIAFTEITVLDTVKPTFTAPANITIYTDDNCTFDASVSVTGDVTNEADNCSTGLEATFVDDTVAGTCLGAYVITRTWSLVDNCGNAAADQEQTITVLDTIAPTFTRPADTTLYKDDNCLAATDTNAAGAPRSVRDNCTAKPLVSYTDGDTTYTCAHSYSFKRTWRVEDECGNHADSIQTITVLDTVAPTFTRPADTTFYAGADWPSSWATAQRSFQP